MKKLINLILWLSVFLCSAYGQSRQGIWEAQGHWEGLGDYTGQVELRWNGVSYNFIRLVAFQNFTYGDRAVSVAWTGSAAEIPNGLRIDVALRQADFIPIMGDESRTEADRDLLLVTGSFQIQGEDRRLTGRYVAEDSRRVYVEEELRNQRPLTETPIFTEARNVTAMHEPLTPELRGLFFTLFRDYHQLPALARYRDREEFQRAVHSAIADPTNYDFYQANPKALRVVNKIVDPIALTEESLRAGAYSYSLREKADLYEALTRENINPATGMMDDFDVTSSTHRPNGDAALWTGVYVAGQAMRYLVTGEEEAADNMARSLRGLFTLMDITGDPREFARTLRQAMRPLEGDWRAGSEPFTALDWLCCGNNDMLKGLHYGLLWGYMALPPRYEEVKQGIRERSATLARFGRIANGGWFNEMTTTALAYYVTGLDEFGLRYDRIAGNPLHIAWIAGGNGAMHYQGISDWSGQHLNIVSLMILNVLARATGDARAMVYQLGLKSGFEILQRTRPTLWTLGYAGLGSWVGRASEEVIEDARWRLREFPFPRPYALAIDHSIQNSWVMSPYPALPWKLDWMTNPGRQQGLYMYPLFEGGDDSYLWKANPLSIRRGASNIRASGTDYLHAYWLGRYFQVFDKGE
ncbi:MAG: hypothetical protein HYR55_09615 [Acidobacteria bacterium]|nr:hypothetical protein [Acidobacteriota bacterium]MBI3655441.1 hypothetical protein [Acidobacteriota bacterium]